MPTSNWPIPRWCRRCIERAQSKQTALVTTNILCNDGWLDKVFYSANDVFQYLSYLIAICYRMFMFSRPKEVLATGRLSRADAISRKTTS